MPETTYQEQVDQKRMLMIRSMLTGLPRSCSDFIRRPAHDDQYIDAPSVHD